MGQNIQRTHFTDHDFCSFNNKLAVQLAELRNLIDHGLANEGEPSIGAELEMYLVDENLSPLPINQQVISDIANSQLQEELNKYNLEFNLSPVNASGNPFGQMAKELDDMLKRLQKHLKAYHGNVIPIGILPTLTPHHLDQQYMTELPRYFVLARQLSSLKGDDFEIDIHGSDELKMQCPQVTLEGANTSFQVHLKVPSANFKSMFNAAQLVTPIVTAVAANSPLLFGKKLWHETRVALFKQSIDARAATELNWHQPARVNFGHGWVRNDAWELFAENVRLFKPIIPLCSASPFAELCLHHGTIWNWNRAVFQPGESAHFRIEFRSLPAGPTIQDMMANAAFMIGLTQYYSHTIDNLITCMPFRYADYNFYRAAQHGLNAKLVWPELEQTELIEMNVIDIALSLLDKAKQGLNELKVNNNETEMLLAIIEARLVQRQNGAIWQLKKYQELLKHLSQDQALSAMLECYCQHSGQNQPVANWPV
ncbi:glutamate-cysteine ligase family protein [Pseudoalteromonas sp.]|uniref:glutamate-cysteine ligase family protein n=1 Tax=Pseudoalteromonas sp. TaxID=53249 RepID=UPI0035624226